MMRDASIKLSLFFTLIIVLTNCASKQSTTIVGDKYIESKNHTEYFIFPYGSVTIPGKWEKSNYNNSSKQQFFTNQDSVFLAITFAKDDKYEFNKDVLHKGFDFVNAFYEWDSQYFIDTFGLERKQLESDTINHYMVYKIYGEREEKKYDTYFLVGEKNRSVSVFTISTTDKWTENEKIVFLRTLFLNQ